MVDAQAKFFRNIGTIMSFAFVGTFVSAVVIGCVWRGVRADIRAALLYG